MSPHPLTLRFGGEHFAILSGIVNLAAEASPDHRQWESSEVIADGIVPITDYGGGVGHLFVEFEQLVLRRLRGSAEFKVPRHALLTNIAALDLAEQKKTIVLPERTVVVVTLERKGEAVPDYPLVLHSSTPLPMSFQTRTDPSGECIFLANPGWYVLVAGDRRAIVEVPSDTWEHRVSVAIE